MSDDMDALIAARFEVGRLRAELAAANKRSDTHYDLLVIALRERNTALANVSKLRAALEPFAAIETIDDYADSDSTIVGFTVGNIRHARAVLKETTDEQRLDL